MFGLKRARKRIQQLERENAAMRKALDFYATSANWQRTTTSVPGRPVQWVKSPAGFDRGERAKFVLATLFVNQDGSLSNANGGDEAVQRVIDEAADQLRAFGREVELKGSERAKFPRPTVPAPLAQRFNDS